MAHEYGWKRAGAGPRNMYVPATSAGRGCLLSLVSAQALSAFAPSSGCVGRYSLMLVRGNRGAGRFQRKRCNGLKRMAL